MDDAVIQQTISRMQKLRLATRHKEYYNETKPEAASPGMKGKIPMRIAGFEWDDGKVKVRDELKIATFQD